VTRNNRAGQAACVVAGCPTKRARREERILLHSRRRIPFPARVFPHRDLWVPV
jgi:hypothetical protein